MSRGNDAAVQGLDASGLRALFEKARDAILVADDQARYVDANPAACELFGLPRDELIGRRISDFVEPGRSELMLRQWQAFRHGHDGQDTGEFVLRRPDGKQRRLEYRAVRDMLPGLHLSILRDVSTRAELLADAELGAELVALGESLVAELDLDRLVQAVTDAATRLSGAAFGALFYAVLGTHGETYSLYTISGVPREAFERFPMPRKTAVFGPTFDGAGIIRSDDITRDPRYGHNAPHRGMPAGHLPVRSYLSVPVIARSGEVIGGLFLGHPEAGVFTERAEHLLRGLAAHAAVAIENARLYNRMSQAVAALHEANERKDEFLAMLAHELRNPLAPLTNALVLLERTESLTERGQQALALAQRQRQQLQRLVDDLLEVSRITRGKIELRCESVMIGTAIYQAVESVTPACETRGHRLTVELPVEPVRIHADPARLAQILENLLHNACKYTPHGGRIRVTVQTHASEVEIKVIDSGIGIEPAKLPLLFELFHQIDATLDRSAGGLGIGLALVKRLVELHGGSVAAQSDGLGKGSTFTVRLPRSSG